MALIPLAQQLGGVSADTSAPPHKGGAAVDVPRYCAQNCRGSQCSSGFSPDFVGKDAKITLLSATPLKQDFISGPFTSTTAKKILHYLEKEVGLTREEVMVSHVIRCGHNRRGEKEYNYPLGNLRGHMEQMCRYHDRQIEKFDPNLFLVTVDFWLARKLEAALFLFLEDCKKALRLREKGHRPLLVCGNEPFELLFPELKGTGGAKAWRGHYYIGSWRWKSGTKQEDSTLVEVTKYVPPQKKQTKSKQLTLF